MGKLYKVQFNSLVADERHFTRKQLKAAGLSHESNIVFNRANNHTVEMEMEDDMIDMLKADGGFKITEVEQDVDEGEKGDAGKPEPEPKVGKSRAQAPNTTSEQSAAQTGSAPPTPATSTPAR